MSGRCPKGRWRSICALALFLSVFPVREVSGFIDPTGPAQLAYLAKILAEDFRRFAQLQQMIQQGHAQADLLRWVNTGMDEIMGILVTLPVKDQEILGNLQDFQKALATVDLYYGGVPKSREQEMQSLHDETIAESFKLASALKDYAAGQEQTAGRAFEMANGMSPKGAERLSAATNAQILHAMAQLLRINGELLKLHGEQFALTNKQEKTSVEHFTKTSQDVTATLSNFSGDLSLPRFP